MPHIVLHRLILFGSFLVPFGLSACSLVSALLISPEILVWAISTSFVHLLMEARYHLDFFKNRPLRKSVSNGKLQQTMRASGQPWVLQLSGDGEEGLGDAEWAMSASHPGSSRPVGARLHVPMSPVCLWDFTREMPK